MLSMFIQRFMRSRTTSVRILYLDHFMARLLVN